MPKLTDLQLQKISDILVIVGEVIFALIVIPYFLDISKKDTKVLFLGLLLTLINWLLSVIMIKKINK